VIEEPCTHAHDHSVAEGATGQQGSDGDASTTLRRAKPGAELRKANGRTAPELLDFH